MAMFNQSQRIARASEPIRLTAREMYELGRAVVILQDVQSDSEDDGLFEALADVIDELHAVMKAASISGRVRR